MAYYAYNSNVMSAGVRHVLANDDTVYVGAQGFLGSSTAQALTVGATTDTARVIVQGALVAWWTACELQPASGQMRRADILVSPTGAIDGRVYGIAYTGSGLALTNDGQISGGTSAVFLVSGIERANRIINSGTMTGGEASATILGSGTGRVEVTNTGTIASTGYAPAIDLGAMTATDASAAIYNTGRILGAVQLSGGDDGLDNRGGVVTDVIRFGGGSDTLLPGLGDEFAYGDAGVDVLDFRGEGAVIVALDGSLAGTGRAAGDEYDGFEAIFGSVRADVLVGDGADNVLFGRGGADTLSGGLGADTLRGGLGGDRLNGGLGNDAFAYGTVFEGGDVIVDFGRVTGNNDRFLIAAALGGELGVGALPGGAFAAVADLAAIQADDRLIFRTTDTTVWFDEDGAGGAAAVLLADLQAGAVVTAADFTVY
jgi:Ca2+-binding RTX toxin-like protein